MMSGWRRRCFRIHRLCAIPVAAPYRQRGKAAGTAVIMFTSGTWHFKGASYHTAAYRTANMMAYADWGY